MVIIFDIFQIKQLSGMSLGAPGFDAQSRVFMDEALSADGGIAKWALVQIAKKQLQDVIRRTGSDDIVFVFGGCLAIGLWDGSCDVDFCSINVGMLFDPKHVVGNNPRLEQRMETTMATLVRDGFERRSLTGIINTRVPILRHHASGAATPDLGLVAMDFDLSFQGYGLWNSWLQRHYIMQTPSARLGAIVVKKWAKLTGISDSRSGFLSPYAVVIMWLH